MSSVSAAYLKGARSAPPPLNSANRPRLITIESGIHALSIGTESNDHK